jgi:acetolactate synthase-1/3 small subunit
MATTKHIIVALVENKPGVLNRMVSLFRRRGFNIESLVVGRSELPHLSRMTIVVDGAANMVEQVRKQLDKIVDIFRANIIDVAVDSVTIEVTGDGEKINSLFNLLRGFGIKEMNRTGLIATTRGMAGVLPVAEGLTRIRGKGQKMS